MIRSGLIVYAWLVASAGAALAGQKTVVFPFDLLLQQKEEDFFIGAGKPSPAEQDRLKLVTDELRKLVAADPRYEVVDIASIMPEVEKQAPFTSCNGCEVDLAKKVGGAIAFTGAIDKASDTLLNMQIGILDVEKGQLLNTAAVVIQGNTDDAWLRGVRWLMKNRLSAEAKPQ